MNKQNWAYKTLRMLYHKYVPFLWTEKIDLFLHDESFLYKPVLKETYSIFIHIPKSAGTSISRTLYGRTVGHYRAILYKNISTTEYEKYFKFSIVRNPWDRLVSAYTFVVQNGSKHVRPLPNEIYKSESFSTFDKFITEWLPYQNLFEIDVVFCPQYHFICDNKGKVIVDYIGKFENIDSAMEDVSKQLGCNINLKKLNASDRNKNYRDYYTDETIKIVSELYKKDIELFSYDF